MIYDKNEITFLSPSSSSPGFIYSHFTEENYLLAKLYLIYIQLPSHVGHSISLCFQNRKEKTRHFKLADVGHAISMHQILTRVYHKIIHTLFRVLQRRQLAFLYTPLSLSGTSSFRECYTCIC